MISCLKLGKIPNIPLKLHKFPDLPNHFLYFRIYPHPFFFPSPRWEKKIFRPRRPVSLSPRYPRFCRLVYRLDQRFLLSSPVVLSSPLATLIKSCSSNRGLFQLRSYHRPLCPRRIIRHSFFILRSFNIYQCTALLSTSPRNSLLMQPSKVFQLSNMLSGREARGANSTGPKSIPSRRS